LFRYKCQTLHILQRLLQRCVMSIVILKGFGVLLLGDMSLFSITFLRICENIVQFT
jgi:hypothetical protein